MKPKRTNPDFVNGVPELLILEFLARRPMHGYELAQCLQGAAGEALAFGEGCVYPILHRLERDKLLDGRTQLVGRRQRIVYHVTAAGRKRLAERVGAWQRIARAIAQILQGESDGVVKLA